MCICSCAYSYNRVTLQSTYITFCIKIHGPTYISTLALWSPLHGSLLWFPSMLEISTSTLPNLPKISSHQSSSQTKQVREIEREWDQHTVYCGCKPFINNLHPCTSPPHINTPSAFSYTIVLGNTHTHIALSNNQLVVPN